MICLKHNEPRNRCAKLDELIRKSLAGRDSNFYRFNQLPNSLYLFVVTQSVIRCLLAFCSRPQNACAAPLVYETWRAADPRRLGKSIFSIGLGIMSKIQSECRATIAFLDMLYSQGLDCR